MATWKLFTNGILDIGTHLSKIKEKSESKHGDDILIETEPDFVVKVNDGLYIIYEIEARGARYEVFGGSITTDVYKPVGAFGLENEVRSHISGTKRHGWREIASVEVADEVDIKEQCRIAVDSIRTLLRQSGG